MVSLKLNNTELSASFIDYTPVFEQSWKTKDTSNTVLKHSDHGQSLDVFKTKLTLAMPVADFNSFIDGITAVSGTYNSGVDTWVFPFETTEQLFVPGVNIASGNCEFVSYSQLGFNDFRMNRCVYELVLNYTVPQIIAGDYSAEFQSIFNSSLKSPKHYGQAFSLQVYNKPSARISYYKHIRFSRTSFNCAYDLIKPSALLPIVSFYRINRSEPFQLTISDPNIIGSSGVFSVVLHDLFFERKSNGLYDLRFSITLR